MIDFRVPSRQKLNVDDYRDRVLGCWTGKNIGGTLGGPFELTTEMNDAQFYVQDLAGAPAPNDDLDLQLVWLQAAEENGIYRVNERLLGEYWLNEITGPWNEYGVCKCNLRNGLTPPLSGSCNNEKWKFSNGAWIRSEIWACIFPGMPDEAIRFAYCDSCVDHCGEGIYAELFTAALESAAFVVRDVRKLIAIALSKIPADCRVARAVKLACDAYDHKMEFAAARNAIVKDSADLGLFQAPGNLGFTVLGLLYGEGDFSRAVILANNCGDDTDCTAGTAGAVMGILLGRKGIPRKWTDPIGENIITCSINTFGRSTSNTIWPLPKTLDELTGRVMALAEEAQRQNGALPRFTAEASCVTPDYVDALSGDSVARKIWERSPYTMTHDLPFGQLTVNYEKGPFFRPGEAKTLTFGFTGVRWAEKIISVRLILPEEWTAVPAAECQLNTKREFLCRGRITVIPGTASAQMVSVPAEIRVIDRLVPYVVQLPFQQTGTVDFDGDPQVREPGFWEQLDRVKSRQ